MRCEYLQSQQANIRVIDTRQHPAGAEKLPKNVPLHTGSLNQQWLLESDIIVISRTCGKTPEIQTALSAGVEVIGDIELFCRAATKPIVGITGLTVKAP